MERRVALLARDLTWADTSGGVLPFSYAARKLEASVRCAPDLHDVATTTIDIRSDDPDVFFERIREYRPTLVAASTYIWSVKLFCEVAERVRKWDPRVRFVMGGPAARPSVLDLPPYSRFAGDVDAIAVGEGEEVIRAIVREHLQDDWRSRAPGLTFRGSLGWRKGPAAERPALDAYASPYQLGLVAQDEVGFLETFRGCPIGCAFCQWGEERSDRVHSAEYLASHLRGMAEAGVRRVYVLDAGFNLSPRAFRNVVQAEQRENVLRDCQVLGHIYPTHLRDEHLEFFSTFRRAEITVGVQSFDPAVLKRLGRPFDIARFERVMARLEGQFDIDLELILGLPGDNPESFRRTLDRAMELATTVRVFYCLALPDALLERTGEFGVEFDPETFKVTCCEGWSQQNLSREWDRVREIAASCHRPNIAEDWVDFRTSPELIPPKTGREQPLRLTSLLAELGRALADSQSVLHPTGVRPGREGVLLDLSGAEQSVVLAAQRAGVGSVSFLEREGVAYSHRGRAERVNLPELRRAIDAVHPIMKRFLLEVGPASVREPIDLNGPNG